MNDELKALKLLYKETKDPILQLHLIAVGKSINKLLEQQEILLFDTLSNPEVMNKVMNDIDYQTMNNWLIEKGYLQAEYKP